MGVKLPAAGLGRVHCRCSHLTSRTLILTIEFIFIFLLGIGDLKNKTYDRIQEQIGININKDKFISESNYIPICKDGTQNKEVEDKLIAIKIDDFRQIAKKKDHYVIAIVGGEHKREAVEAALANPYFNVVVTDEKIARYLLDGR